MLKERLKTLVLLDKEKNYTKTAKLLNISQPAVSQHIKSLEDDYNIIIFKKTGKEFKTTQEGEILIKNAKRLLAIDKNISKELLLSTTNLRKVDIGITLTASGYFIPELLNQFKEKYSEIRYNFHTDISENIFERLKYHDLDFAIVDGKPTDKNFESHLLTTDELIIIAHPTNPLVNKSLIDIEDIMLEKFILRHKAANTRVSFEEYLEKYGHSSDELDIILEIDNTSLIKQLIKDGHGISVISKAICELELKYNALVQLNLKDFAINRGIYLVYLKENKNDYIIKNIKELIENRGSKDHVNTK